MGGALTGGYLRGRDLAQENELRRLKIEQAQAEADARKQVAAIDTDFTPRQTPVASGEDAYNAGMDAYNQAAAGAATDEQKAEVARNYTPTLQALQDQRTTPARVAYSMGTGAGFRQRSTQFTPDEVQNAKTQERAAVYSRAGLEDDAWRTLRNAATSRDLADHAQVRAAFANRDQVAAQPVGPVDQSETTGGDPGISQVRQGVDAPLTKPAVDAYRAIKAPQVIDTYLRLGKVEEARRYRDFIDSEEGRGYTYKWSKGVRRLAIGDHNGALAIWQDLYNKQLYPDGNTVQLSPSDDAKQVTATFFDKSGQPIHAATQPMDSFARQAGMALAPEKLVEFQAKEEGARTREGALLDRQVQLEGMRQSGREAQDNRRDERLGMRLDAQSSALERRLQAMADRGLTTAQQQKNDSIDAARTQLEGMSQADIQRKTQSSLSSGRSNPEYDGQLARTARLANMRKFGDDEQHDAFSSGKKAANAAANDRADIADRFRADKTMQSRRLGADTPNGVEVWEKGKLIGYFR